MKVVSRFLKRWKPRRIAATGVIALLFASLVFSFQNCTQPAQVDPAAILSSAAKDVDFAYDATFDQIGYMSCSNMTKGTYDRSAYFSYRIGSYRNAGLKLTDAFLDTYKKKKPEYISDLLFMSPANTSTVMQVSIRVLNNYQSLLTGATGTATKGDDYHNILEPLGTEGVSDLLVGLPEGKRLKYVRNGTPYGSRMEASLYFATSYSLAESVRQFLRNEGVLGLTFTHTAGSGTETLARSPSDVLDDSNADPSRSVYGRGYSLRFGQPNGASGQFPTNILSGVTEMSLLNASDRTGLGTWTCPVAMQLKIVRPQDVDSGAVKCNRLPDPAVLPSNLAIVRNTLRAEDWYVDLANKCIIPKKAGTGCYGSYKKVVYDPSKTCNANGDDTCVQFASICYRTN